MSTVWIPACFLQQQIRLVRGVQIPIVTDETNPRDYEFVIGRTTRENYDNIIFNRQLDTPWEYVVKTVGTRVYLTGLGALDTEEKPYTSAYNLMYDNANATVYAVYNYVEKVLNYNFSYVDWDGFPTVDELDVPEYNYEYTRDVLRQEQVELFDGAAFYSLASCEIINWSINSFILKTKSGKLNCEFVVFREHNYYLFDDSGVSENERTYRPRNIRTARGKRGNQPAQADFGCALRR